MANRATRAAGRVGRAAAGLAGILLGAVLSLLLFPPALVTACIFFPVNLLLSFWWALTTPRFGWRVRMVLFFVAWLAALTLLLLELLGFPAVFPALSLVQPVVSAGVAEAVCMARTVVEIGLGMLKSVWRNHVALVVYVVRPQRHGRRVDVANICHLPAVVLAAVGLAVWAMLAALGLSLVKLPLAFLAGVRAVERRAYKSGGAGRVVLAVLCFPLALVWGALMSVAMAVTAGLFAVGAAGYGAVSPFRALWLYRKWTRAGVLVGSWLYSADEETGRALGIPAVLPHFCRCIPPPTTTLPWEPQITEVSEEFYSQRECTRGDPSQAPRDLRMSDNDGAWQLTVEVFRAAIEDALAEGLLTRDLLERFAPEAALNPGNAVVCAVVAVTLFDTAWRTVRAGEHNVDIVVSKMPTASPLASQSARVFRMDVEDPSGARGKRLGRTAPLATALLSEVDKASKLIAGLGALPHSDLVWIRWWLAGWDDIAFDWYCDASGGAERLARRLARRGVAVEESPRTKELQTAATKLRDQARRAAALFASRRFWQHQRARDEVANLARGRVPPAVASDFARSCPEVLLAQSPAGASTKARASIDFGEVNLDSGTAAGVVDGSYHPASPARACHARLLIDGEEFFAEARRIIATAQREVLISSWKLCPWVGMGRREDPADWRRWKDAELTGKGEVGGDVPIDQGDTLLELMVRRATEGVRIYVLLFQNHPDIMGTHFNDEASQILAEANDALPEGCAGCILSLRHPSPEACTRAGLHGEAIADRGTAPSYALSHHQKFMVIDRTKAIIGGFDLCIGRWDSQAHLLSDPRRRIWPGQDFYCPAVGVAGHLPESQKEWLEHDYIDSTQEVRLPWHDTAVLLEGEVAADAASAFIDRWNHHREPPARDSVEELRRGPLPASPPTAEAGVPPLALQRAQVLRSFAPWCGGGCVEMSVYGAYVAAIRSAQNFVYIENQYVSSSCGTGAWDDPENVVLQCVLERLVDSRKRGCAHFRVILVVTLPEETDDSAAGLIRWLLRALYRGEHCLTQRLLGEHGWTEDDLRRHVSCCLLRSHAVLPRREAPEDTPGEHPQPWLGAAEHARRHALLAAGPTVVAAMVFCHSKLLIVDDKIVVVGSANLNDRSLLGRRDSELCAAFVDHDTTEVTVAGRPCTVGKRVHVARMRLWAEHLGLDWPGDGTLANACGDEMMKRWNNAADANALLYQLAFPGCVPSNGVRRLDAYTPMPFRAASDSVSVAPEDEQRLHELGVSLPGCRVTVWDLVSRVRGHLYRFPPEFLAEDDLAPTSLTALSVANGFQVMQ